MENKEAGARERIVREASHLMGAKGIKETSLSDIAKAVGISKGTLYYYFASKDELVLAIADRYFRQAGDVLIEGVQSWIRRKKDSGASIESILIILMKTLTGNQLKTRMHLSVLLEGAINKPELAEKLAESYRKFREMIKIMAAEIAGESSEVFSYILLAVVDGLAIQNLIEKDSTPYAEIAKYWLK